MRYIHDTTVHLTKEEALTLAQYLIKESLDEDFVRLNLEMKYPLEKDSAPRLTFNTAFLSIEAKTVWAMVDGSEIYDSEFREDV